MSNPLNVYLVTGEPSGDVLGGALMTAINETSTRDVTFSGIGGARMADLGFESLFPLSELSLMGIGEIVAQLPKILRLINQTVEAIVARQPDVLVIIDSPDFTHVVAKRVRKRVPHIPIVNYVSPTVWAWRSGRAKRMRKYIDRVLAIYPFETDVYKRLSGPPCVYVGHPMVERLAEFCGENSGNLKVSKPPQLLVMPGSRQSEVRRLMQPFGEALSLIQERIPDVEAIIPVVPTVRPLIEDELRSWNIQPKLMYTQEEKFVAFRSATAAIVASGTASLELALARVPMVAGYKIEWLAYQFSWLLQAHSILLPNLIAGENFVPVLFQNKCSGQAIADKIIDLLASSETRQRQLDGFQVISQRLAIDGKSPSRLAASEILNLIGD